nr:Dihydrofolate reductase [uncultured bacterium]
MPKISMIAALSKNNVIGDSGHIPWYISEELKRFRKITTGHPIIMGRKTHQSIGKILPDRTNIIITRDLDFAIPGGVVVHSLEEALTEAAGSPGAEEIMVIGGGEIYRQVLPQADRLYLTVVDAEMEGDVYFPDYSEFKKVVSHEETQAGGYNLTYLTLERT